jgi:hypothetical protein
MADTGAGNLATHDTPQQTDKHEEITTQLEQITFQ